MSATLLVKYLHVLSGIWLISGLLGRWVVLAAAARAAEMPAIHSLVAAASRFEFGMVRPASIGVLASGLLLAWMQDQPLLGMFQGAGANWLLVSLLLYLSSIPLIVGVFIPRGKIFERALADATSRSTVTPALRAAFADRAVYAGHVTELAVAFLILLLMVTRFF